MLMVKGSKSGGLGQSLEMPSGEDILSVSLSMQVQKWAPVNCSGNLTESPVAICDGLASHLEEQERNVLSGNCKETEVK